ncbi:hypothetical protein [Streptomyces sp. NPDC006267]|uniref:hypothetical protein n=1 Tax=Streptomyces sp. NPDC006267 TaxID=3157173 RepID=UPI0033BF468A
MTEEDEHVCKPGATVYYCPTAGDTESDCHGGFDTCCSATDLHQQLAAHQVQPGVLPSGPPGTQLGATAGMDPVRCEGFGSDLAAATRRRRALAFNAVQPVLAKHDRHLPLSIRQEIAEVVLAAIDNPH